MISNNTHLAELNSPNQVINARVELYNGSALEKICTCGDILSSLTLEKTGEGKFFGYGVCQKLRFDLIDLEREFEITKNNTVEVAFGVRGDFIYTCPNFYVDTVERDETSNILSVTAYDVLYKASNHTVAELELQTPYSIRLIATACATLLGIPIVIDVNDDSFDTIFADGANFDGTETIRSALNAIAEATQTIYYIDSNWDLVFKRLSKDGDPVITINKDQYIDFKNDGPRVLSEIVHTTELGDNISSTSTIEGVTQYVRDNPFWELREDTGELIEKAKTRVVGTSINQFECNWIGNYLIELGDKIGLVAEDNSIITTYVLDDVVTYDGALSQVTKWHYNENDAETESNPTSLGEALNKTFARVDKVNKQVEMVAGETSGNSAAISTLLINTDSINASVLKIEENTSNSLDALNETLNTLTQRVDATITAEDVTITVNNALENGVTKVETTTGFTFNDEGLHIGKSNSGIENTIDNTGMYVKSDGIKVLSANNSGVEAKNLHANTYLIIGNNSRLEDYDGNRTGCFWIGGN